MAPLTRAGASTRGGALLAAVALATSLGAAGCARSGSLSAAGAPDIVSIVVGEGVPVSAAERLERVLRPAEGAADGPLLHVERVPADRLGSVRGRRNLLILANLNVPGGVARAARDVLSPEQVSEVTSGGAIFFVASNVWGRDQVVVVVPGMDAAGVLSAVEIRGEKIREAVVTATRERVAHDLFRGGDDRSASTALAAAAGWTLRLPKHGWRIDRTRESEGVVRVHAASPERVLLVRWVPADSSRLAVEGALALLDETTERFGRGERLAREEVRARQAAFLGRPAFLVSGPVRRPGGGSAGSLEAALLIDPGSGRLYLIDRRVFAGGADPTHGLWELDALAGTLEIPAKRDAGAG